MADTERDMKPPRNGRMPPWAWALLGALGVGGPSGAMAYLRGAPLVTPAEADTAARAITAEAKVEAMKAAEIADIKADVGALKKGQERQGKLLSRIAEKLRVRDDEPEEER